VQPSKCVAWSPKGLHHFISFPFSFLIIDSSFCIFGASVGSTSFVESFMTKAFHDDLGTRSNLPMLTNP